MLRKVVKEGDGVTLVFFTKYAKEVTSHEMAVGLRDILAEEFRTPGLIVNFSFNSSVKTCDIFFHMSREAFIYLFYKRNIDVGVLTRIDRLISRLFTEDFTKILGYEVHKYESLIEDNEDEHYSVETNF
jgi:hypothetical protein